MGHCPVCQTGIDANHGDMIPCPQCHTLLFVDFAGNIIVGGEQDTEGEDFPADLPSAETGAADIELPSSDYHEVPADPGYFDPDFANPDLSEPLPVEAALDQQPASWEQPVPYDQNLTENHSTYLQDQPDQQPGAFQYESSGPAVEVRDSAGPRGQSVSYRMIIEGIDSSDLRRAVLDALRESRLGLVNNEVAADIVNGRLVVQGLNPVKASFIMNSLKELPVEINWQVYEAESTSENQ